MKGTVGYAEHAGRYYVAWYHAPHKKTYKVYHYKGEPLYHTKIAEKLLSCMQADTEKGIFRIEQYTKIPCACPCEAMALHNVDFDGQIFIVHRSFSSRQLTDTTKTGEIHYLPLIEEFIPDIDIEREKQSPLSFVSPYFFVNPDGKTPGKPYTHKVLSDLSKAAATKVGESIKLYPGLKHSSRSQFINEHGYNIHDLHIAGDWARLESVKKYGKVGVSARKALLGGKVIKFKGSGTKLERERRN